MLEAMRTEGVPPPACRAVMFGALRYLNAELLNALVLRRDCCSTSAVKALKVELTCHIPVAVFHRYLWKICLQSQIFVIDRCLAMAPHHCLLLRFLSFFKVIASFLKHEHVHCLQGSCTQPDLFRTVQSTFIYTIYHTLRVILAFTTLSICSVAFQISNR